MTLWVAVIALLLRERIRIRTLELVYVGGMLAFTAWVALLGPLDAVGHEHDARSSSVTSPTPA